MHSDAPGRSIQVFVPTRVEHPVDLADPARGAVRWNRPRPMDDPAIAELERPLMFPPEKSGDGSEVGRRY